MLHLPTHKTIYRIKVLFILHNSLPDDNENNAIQIR